MRLRVCSYNIHKGFSQFNRRMAVHDLRERLRELAPDLVFLQEVQGMHLRHAERHADWPSQPQHEFIAQGTWPQAAYGGNAVHRYGHHGNAVLSRLPILRADNQDISLSRLERRGLLHCVIELPGGQPLHAICVHVSLTEAQRRLQLQALAQRVQDEIPREAPLIVAGDFNDWQRRANGWFESQLGMREVFTQLHGKPARSFPCHLPILTLDRIYFRGLQAVSAQVLHGPPWPQISDHAPLLAELDLAEA